MLPIILGIGAAALLLGRKAVKRIRSNPRKRRMVRRRRRNPDGAAKQVGDTRFRVGDEIVVNGRRWRVDVAQRVAKDSPAAGSLYATWLLVGPKGGQAYLHEHHSGKFNLFHAKGGRESVRNVYLAKASRVNPSRRRKGKRVSVDQAASRLAWWRWHHNPADSVWRLVKIHPRRGFAQRSPVWEYEHKRTGERRRIVQNWRGPAPAGWPHLPETNPRRRRRVSRRK